MLDPKLLVMLAVGTLLLINGILGTSRRPRPGSAEADEGAPERPATADEGL